MRIQITAVRMAPSGNGHEHINELQWFEIGNPGNAGWDSRQVVVNFVDSVGNTAVVADGNSTVGVRSRHPIGQNAYVQTYRDDTPTDNLLHLPGGPLYGR